MSELLSDAAVLSALIGAVVAVVGLLINQRHQRVERRALIFADALRCIRAYQELPYEVWRRLDNKPATRARLRESRERAYHDINYHLQRLQIEAPIAAQAYEDLFEQTRRQDRMNREPSWRSCIASPDLKPWEGPTFPGKDNGKEIELCVLAMRVELSLLRSFRLLGLRSRLNKQRGRRQFSEERSERATLEADIEPTDTLNESSHKS